MDQVTVFRDQGDQWRWRRRSENGQIVSTSGEGYENLDHALIMAKNLNPDTSVDVED